MNRAQLESWLTACFLVRRHGALAPEQCLGVNADLLVWVDQLLIADAIERENLWRFERLRAMHHKLYGEAA